VFFGRGRVSCLKVHLRRGLGDWTTACSQGVDEPSWGTVPAAELPSRVRVPRHGRRAVLLIPVHLTWKACGSLQVAVDGHPWAVMQIPRHSKVAVTMELYGQVVSSTTQESPCRLGEQQLDPGQRRDCCCTLVQ